MVVNRGNSRLCTDRLHRPNGSLIVVVCSRLFLCSSSFRLLITEGKVVCPLSASFSPPPTLSRHVRVSSGISHSSLPSVDLQLFLSSPTPPRLRCFSFVLIVCWSGAAYLHYVTLIAPAPSYSTVPWCRWLFAVWSHIWSFLFSAHLYHDGVGVGVGVGCPLLYFADFHSFVFQLLRPSGSPFLLFLHCVTHGVPMCRNVLYARTTLFV